jgi:hypothetical protein
MADESIAAEAFLGRAQRLSAGEWQEVMNRARPLGAELDEDALIRGAVVALTVRPALSLKHFETLYMPFAGVIPLGSLPPPLMSLD